MDKRGFPAAALGLPIPCRLAGYRRVARAQACATPAHRLIPTNPLKRFQPSDMPHADSGLGDGAVITKARYLIGRHAHLEEDFIGVFTCLGGGSADLCFASAEAWGWLRLAHTVDLNIGFSGNRVRVLAGFCDCKHRR